eukprot:3782423-Rhodomonas_salina.1
MNADSEESQRLVIPLDHGDARVQRSGAQAVLPPWTSEPPTLCCQCLVAFAWHAPAGSRVRRVGAVRVTRTGACVHRPATRGPVPRPPRGSRVPTRRQDRQVRGLWHGPLRGWLSVGLQGVLRAEGH